MITIFEGKRNSGKTYLSTEFSKLTNVPIFKFEFAKWFQELGLSDSSKKTHYFALGKESMLLQLHRDGFLKEFILDRGILTVLTWGILSKRVSENKIYEQLEITKKLGLLKNIRVVYVVGNNPETKPRQKDNWDKTESNNYEDEILSSLINIISEGDYGVEVIRIENDFTPNTIEKLKSLV